jgi:glutamate dehydrogenase (NAD(P)+)
MAWVHSEIGRAVGLPREIGGIPLDELGATGFGLAHACEVAAARSGLELAGARVVVQGFGSVGQHAARFLADRGALLVAASDSRGAVHDPKGLDLAALVAAKRAGWSVAERAGGRPLAPEALLGVECEIWIPAARPDAIREEDAPRMRTRLVVPGANIPATHGAERWLHEHGIVCVPDFIANAGGVICAAMEYHGASQRAAFEAIEERVRSNTDEVLRESERRRVPPREAAVDLALSRVRRAMAWRRWAVY